MLITRAGLLIAVKDRLVRVWAIWSIAWCRGRIIEKCGNAARKSTKNRLAGLEVLSYSRKRKNVLGIHVIRKT